MEGNDITDPHHCAVHEKSRSSGAEALSLQEQASLPMAESGLGNLNLTSNEADLGRAAWKGGAPYSTIRKTSQFTVFDGKAKDLNNFGEHNREDSEEASSFSWDDILHELSISTFRGLSHHSEGADALSFENNSNSFLTQLPDADSCHGTIGYPGHLEFPAEGYQVVSAYSDLKNQYKQTDGGVVSLPEKSILTVVGGQQNVSEKDKNLSAKLQESDQSEAPMYFCKSVISPIYGTMECSSGTSSRRTGIASILEQTPCKEHNLDDLKLKFPSLEKTPVSSISELSQQVPQVYGSETQDAFLSKNNEQETRTDERQYLACGQGTSPGNSSGTIIKKEAPQFLTSESVTENHKLPRLKSSAISSKPAFADSVHPEVKECTSFTDICVKHTVYDESRSIIPNCRDGHISNSSFQNSNSANSDDALFREIVERMVTEGCLSNDEPEEEKKSFCCESIDKTSVQHLESESSSELINSDQGLSSADGLPTFSTKSAKVGQPEYRSSTYMIADFDPDWRKEESRPRNDILADVSMDEHANDHLDALGNFHSKFVHEALETNSALSELVQPDAQETHLEFPGGETVRRMSIPVEDPVFQGQILRAEEECANKKNELGESAVGLNKQIEVALKTSTESCPATTANVGTFLDLKISTAEHGNSTDSLADANGGSNESMNNFEPTLWEQLLESNVKQSTNKENSQDLGNGVSFTGNPFILEYSPPNYEEEPKNLDVEGRDALTLKQLNNDSTTIGDNEIMGSGDEILWSPKGESAHLGSINRVKASPNINSGCEKGHGDVGVIHSREAPTDISLKAATDLFEAPSFMSLVESHNYSERQQSSNEIQPTDTLVQTESRNDSQFGWFPCIPEVANESQENRGNEDLSADAVELSPERRERLHTPLKNLLAEENLRSKDPSKPAIPPLAQEVQTSQRNIEQVHKSTSEVMHPVDTSSPKATLQQKCSSPFAKKMLEKVWSSPARFPSPKVENLKVKEKSFWSMFLCCSFESSS